MVATEWKFHQETLTDELNGTLVDLLVVIIKVLQSQSSSGFHVPPGRCLLSPVLVPSFSANTATFMESCIHNW